VTRKQGLNGNLARSKLKLVLFGIGSCEINLSWLDSLDDGLEVPSIAAAADDEAFVYRTHQIGVGVLHDRFFYAKEGTFG
jgi:hypothetical protein